MMAYDFPSSPADGQVYTPDRSYVYSAARSAWQKRAGTALASNKVVNPTMQISLENGDTVGTSNGYYAADQWFVSKSGTLTATYQFSRQQLSTPNGSPNRILLTITAVQASMASGDWLGIAQRIEGNRLADHAFGTANAVPLVLRFGLKAPAGTYTATVRNGAANRNYTVEVVVPSFTDIEYEFAIPPDTSGTWSVDNTSGMELWFTIACGTGLQGPANTWSTGFISTANQTNGAATTGNFYLWDVGLYADPNKTGKAPPFQCPHYEDDQRDCLRYFEKLTTLNGVVASATTIRCSSVFMVPKRVVPTVTYIGSIRTYDGTVVPTVSGIANAGTTTQHADVTVTAAGGGLTIGRSAGILADGQLGAYVWVGARM